MAETTRNQMVKWTTWLKVALIVLMTGTVGIVLGVVLASPSPAQSKLPITYVGLTVYLLAVLLNPTFGLLLWIATSPFARFMYLNISLGHGIPDLSLDRIAAACIFVLITAQIAIRRRNPARFTLLELCIFLFVLGTTLSLPQALAGPRATIQVYFDSQIVPLLVFLLAKNLIYHRFASRAANATLLFIGAYLAFLVIHEQLTGNILFYPPGRTLVYTAHIRRVVGLLGNPAFFATLLGMILPFNLHAFVEAQRPRAKWVYGVLTAATFFALYLCYNRAGWLASLLAMLFMALFYPRFRRLFVPLLLVAAIAFGLSWRQISESYVITERLMAQAPVDYRLNAIDISLRMVADNPFFGRGYGNFAFLYARYATDWTQARVLPAPHNSYLNILVSAGLAGLVPYVAIFVVIFFQGMHLWRRGRYNRAIDRPLLICMIGSLIVYTATIFFVDVIAAPYVTSVFFFIVGAVLGHQERVQRWGDPKEWLA